MSAKRVFYIYKSICNEAKTPPGWYTFIKAYFLYVSAFKSHFGFIRLQIKYPKRKPYLPYLLVMVFQVFRGLSGNLGLFGKYRDQKFGQIRTWTAELAALEHLKRFPLTFNGRNVYKFI